jgi:hypothetical protein
VRCAPGDLAVYAWGDRRLEFHHCRRCGCVVFHEAAKKKGEATRIAVNARMLDPADTASIRVRLLDGALSWKYLD